MCETERAETQLQRLASAIFVEICKQFDSDGPTAPLICGQGGMRDVLIEGHVDLLRVADALSKRCCLQMPDIETIADTGPAVHGHGGSGVMTGSPDATSSA